MRKTSPQPCNYVTLKQLQELRLKEQQEEKAAKLRPQQADEVEEVGGNQPSGCHLPRTDPKQPSAEPEAKKAWVLGRRSPAVGVAADVPKNYVTLEQLQELPLKEKQDQEERHLKEAHEENVSKQRPPGATEVEEVRRSLPRAHQWRGLLGPVPKLPSTNHVSRKPTGEAGRIHPAANLTAGYPKANNEPLGRGGGKTKPDAAKETKTKMRSAWVACVPSPGAAKKVSEGMLSSEEGDKEVVGTNGALIERRAAETGVDWGIAGAGTEKGTGSNKGNSREWADERRVRGGGGWVWMRKTKPAELV